MDRGCGTGKDGHKGFLRPSTTDTVPRVSTPAQFDASGGYHQCLAVSSLILGE